MVSSWAKLRPIGRHFFNAIRVSRNLFRDMYSHLQLFEAVAMRHPPCAQRAKRDYRNAA
jgi:hypothetical protein